MAKPGSKLISIQSPSQTPALCFFELGWLTLLNVTSLRFSVWLVGWLIG